ncbi:MAG: NUDIX domain-containing protein [Thermoleophilia bacterium]
MPRRPVSLSRRARDRLSEPVAGPRPVAAAVCFRRRDQQLQFRLIRTRDGERWTFPNGGPEAHETPSQAAAREAAQEAGVTGVIAERPLTEYRHGRRGDDLATAFLLAVQSSAPFAGAGRDPTWFNLEHTLEKLAENRDLAAAAELQRVVELAERELEDG